MDTSSSQQTTGAKNTGQNTEQSSNEIMTQSHALNIIINGIEV